MSKSDLGSLGFGQLSKELRGSEFGNTSLSKRYEKMVDAIAQRPKLGFPEIFRSEADLEGAYRFLRNPSVQWHKAIAPHYDATVKRCLSQKEIIVIHDTTECGFSGESTREGLGYINQGGQGFFAHCALAVTAGEQKIPLGVLGLSTIARKQKKKITDQRDPNRESLRWGRMVEQTEERLHSSGSQCAIIHTMDREADIFPLFDDLQKANRQFVIRLCHDRILSDECIFSSISEALKDLVPVSEERIVVSKRARNRGRNKKYARERRMANVQYFSTNVEIKRPGRAPLHCNKTLLLNIVHAREIDAPEDVEPVNWTLATCFAVKTAKQVARVIEIYRTRWVIEEYFKVIKTGCSYERRQLESLHTLLNAMALIIPVAHRLLLLRSISRLKEIDASWVITTTQRKILQALEETRLAKNATGTDIMLAVAKLGGHIKNNGDPGWQVLWRGYEELLKYEIGWRAKK